MALSIAVVPTNPSSQPSKLITIIDREATEVTWGTIFHRLATGRCYSEIPRALRAVCIMNASTIELHMGWQDRNICRTIQKMSQPVS